MLKNTLFVTVSLLMMTALASDSLAQLSPSTEWAVHMRST